MKDISKKNNLPVIDAETYRQEPDRYELREGTADGAPLCPYGNQYQWIGFDRKTKSYLRFTKSVFKAILQERNQM